MKKLKITVLLINLILLTINCIALTSYAAGTGIIDPDKVVNNLNIETPAELTKKVNNVLGTIQVIGTVISVVAIIVIGIKYMTGSVESKASYKKVMIPYIVGAFLIFGISNIVPILYNIFKGLE